MAVVVGPYIPGLVSIKPQWTDSSPSTHECVTWWMDASIEPRTVPQLENIQSLAESLYLSAWVPIGASTAKFHGCIVADYGSPFGLSIPASLTAGVNGSGGPALPNNVAVLCSLKIPGRYRGGHGRMYFPAIGSSSETVDGDHITTAAAAIVSGVLNAAAGGAPTQLQDGPVAPPANFLSQIVLRGRRTLAPAVPIITEIVVQTLLASQRRRLRKAAHH
jgi:hypothetical protein